MVVRSLIRSALTKVPYSDHIPSLVTDILSEEPRQIQLTPAPETFKNPYESESDEAESVSPKVKIHTKILKNRLRDPMDTFPVIEEQDEEVSSYEEDLSYLNHCDTCDDMPLGISTMSSKRASVVEASLDSPAPSFLSGTTARSTINTETAKPSKDDTESHQREIRTKQYLSEQNEKFDELISKNIDVFFKQQNSYEERDSIMNKIEREKRQNNFVRRVIGDTVDSCIRKLGFAGPKESKVPEKDVSQHEDVLSNSSTVKDRSGAHSPQIAALLNNLDHSAKMDLYAQLQKDLGVDSAQVPELPAESTELDKLQTFLILSVKLSISGIKLCIPVVQYFYHKYSNNQIYVVNNKNAHSLADFVLKIMKGLDSRLSHNEEWISKLQARSSGSDVLSQSQPASQELDEKLDGFYEEFTMGATNVLRKSLVSSVGGNEDSWRRAATEYILSMCSTGSGGVKEEDYTNPKYGMYYSSKHNQDKEDAVSGTSSASSPASFKSASTTRQASSDNLEALSVFHIAEKFAGELGP